MGTYIAKISSAVHTGGSAPVTWSNNPAAPPLPNQDYIQFPSDGLTTIADCPAVIANDGFLTCNLSLSNVYLDGNPVDEGLPAGFQIDSANIRMFGSASSGVGDPAIMTLGWNSANLFAYLVSDINAGPIVLPLNITGLNVIQILARPYHAKINSSNFSTRQVIFDEFVIFGNYSIVAFQWTLDPVSGSSVEPEITVTIESDPMNPDHLQLDQLTIEVVGCGSITPSTQTETLLIFSLPAGCTGLRTIQATGNGVQFSGTLSLGQLTIIVADPSGIYTLTPGQTHDTLYSSDRDGTTYNVKIPNPFGKTGFIGG